MKAQATISLMFITTLAALTSACGGGETGDSSTSGASSSSSSSSGVGGAGGSSGEGGGQTGGGGAGVGGGGGGAPSGDLVPNLKSMDLYVDCMPIVGPDPVHGSFTAEYDTQGAPGPTSATITKARLLFGAQSSSYTFTVMPDTSGTLAPGLVLALPHKKTDGSGSGTIMPCTFCNDVWSLEVTFDVNGKAITDTLPSSPVSCVF